MESSAVVVCVVVVAVISLGALALALAALREVRLARETSFEEMRKFAWWTSDTVDKAQAQLVNLVATIRAVPRPKVTPAPRK